MLLKANLIYFGICASESSKVVLFIRGYFVHLAWKLLLTGVEGHNRMARRRSILSTPLLSEFGHLLLTGRAARQGDDQGFAGSSCPNSLGAHV